MPWALEHSGQGPATLPPIFVPSLWAINQASLKPIQDFQFLLFHGGPGAEACRVRVKGWAISKFFLIVQSVLWGLWTPRGKEGPRAPDLTVMVLDMYSPSAPFGVCGRRPKNLRALEVLSKLPALFHHPLTTLAKASSCQVEAVRNAPPSSLTPDSLTPYRARLGCTRGGMWERLPL